MSEWLKLKLRDIIVLNYGKALKTQDRKDGNIPVFSSAGLTGYHNQALIEKEGIIVGRKGTIGKIYISNSPFWCIDTAYYILPNPEKYDFLFIFYLLQTLGLEELNEDSAVPGLNRNTVYNQCVTLPPLPEQKAIASILSSIDDKIDLLHRQNKTLESMAETLFRQWFIEDKQNGWKNYKLGDLTNIFIGRTPPRKETFWFSKNINDIKWLSIKDMAENGVYRFNTNEYLPMYTIEKFKIPIIPKNTVVLSFKMTVGRVGITSQDMVSNEAIAHFRINKIISNEFLYCFLKSFNFDMLGTTSTIVNSINTSLIKSILIRIPNEEKVHEFTLKTSPLFLKIKKNQKQQYLLENLRDTLLPKLMSGEVRVKLD